MACPSYPPWLDHLAKSKSYEAPYYAEFVTKNKFCKVYASNLPAIEFEALSRLPKRNRVTAHWRKLRI
jgi:hypothetical protein